MDGEHYAPVVREALAELPYEFAVAVLVGGTEKLRGGADYGVPVESDVETAIASYRPDVVVDLSDEPVLGPLERFALASRVLAQGLPYVGADFRLDPPERLPFELPSIAVVGTGKRVGKTAVTGQLARLVARTRRVVVVARWGRRPLRAGGDHGATDGRRPRRALTVGASRRVGPSGDPRLSPVSRPWGAAGVEEGLAGAVATSNVSEGAAVALGLAPDLVVFDGSGAALPPIAAAARSSS